MAMSNGSDQALRVALRMTRTVNSSKNDLFRMYFTSLLLKASVATRLAYCGASLSQIHYYNSFGQILQGPPCAYENTSAYIRGKNCTAFRQFHEACRIRLADLALGVVLKSRFFCGKVIDGTAEYNILYGLRKLDVRIFGSYILKEMQITP